MESKLRPRCEIWRPYVMTTNNAPRCVWHFFFRVRYLAASLLALLRYPRHRRLESIAVGGIPDVVLLNTGRVRSTLLSMCRGSRIAICCPGELLVKW